MNNDSPKISIIIPVYNTEKYLSLCIDSILSQSYLDFELLLINDGSIDNSGSICDEYAEKDSRIRVFHQENKGVSRARNLGLNNAKGEWIFFCDSDDHLIAADSLESIIALEDSDIDTFLFSYNYMENGRVINNAQKEIQPEYELCLARDEFLESKCFAKELWRYFLKRDIIETNKIRFNEDISYSEDWLYLLDYIKYSRYICTSSIKVYNHIKHGTSLMSGMYTYRVLKQLLVALKILFTYKRGNKKWTHFIKKQANEMFHFFLYIFSKTELNNTQKQDLILEYRSLFRKSYSIVGLNIKFIVAFISPKLYLLITKI